MDSRPLDWRALDIEPTGAADFACDCCGDASRRVWGFVHNGPDTIAAYFVWWTVGKPGHRASFDLVLGPWGKGSRAAERQLVSLQFSVEGGSPSFMVIDAALNPQASQIAGGAARRADIVGTPAAGRVFPVIDAIYMKDERVAELGEWAMQ